MNDFATCPLCGLEPVVVISNLGGKVSCDHGDNLGSTTLFMEHRIKFYIGERGAKVSRDLLKKRWNNREPKA